MRHMVGTAARRARWGALLAAGPLLVSACSGETAETTTSPLPTSTTAIPATTSATTTSTSTTTTTMPATTTTVDPLARPDVLVSNVNRGSIDDFDTSKDNVYEAVIELLDLFTYLEGNPTGDADEMVSLMFERNYPYWNPIMVGFLELTDNPGWRYVDPGDEIIAADLVSSDGDSAVLRIVHQRSRQIVTDDDGSIVREYDPNPLRATTFTIARGLDGFWRFADVDPSEAVATAEIERMTPVEWKGRQP